MALGVTKCESLLETQKPTPLLFGLTVRPKRRGVGFCVSKSRLTANVSKTSQRYDVGYSLTSARRELPKNESHGAWEYIMSKNMFHFEYFLAASVMNEMHWCGAPSRISGLLFITQVDDATVRHGTVVVRRPFSSYRVRLCHTQPAFDIRLKARL